MDSDGMVTFTYEMRKRKLVLKSMGEKKIRKMQASKKEYRRLSADFI